MEEELIKMETATMMRCIGFDEKTLYAYKPDGNIYVNVDRYAKAYNSVPVNYICFKFIFGYDCQRDHCRDCGLQVYLLSAPTQALAAKWIRETHDINVSVLRMTDSYGGAVSKENLLRYFWHIQIPNRETMVDVGVYHDSYEEATEAGLIKAIGLIQNKLNIGKQ